jgi:hypothetical protein
LIQPNFHSFRNANWGPKTVTTKCQKEFQHYTHMNYEVAQVCRRRDPVEADSQNKICEYATQHTDPDLNKTSKIREITFLKI